jgi:CheY-like chemotaxis protein
VLGFAKQSGGGLRIDSKPGRGTSVRIYLPRAAAGQRRAEERRAGSLRPSQAGRAKLLLVDDDNAVREVLSANLTDLGYEVVEAGSGGAALETLQREADIDLVLLDFAMPGMNGAEVARRIEARHPGLPILFVTGFADRTALAGVGESHIIGKPPTDGDLATKVAAALASVPSRKVVHLV